MSPRRFIACFNIEFLHSFKRPLFIALMLFLALTAFGLSSGSMQISSGDSSVGGTKAWITSEFAQTQTMAYLTLLYYAFFIAAAAGLTLLRDREVKVDVILHSTPITPGEYVWGRFFAVVGGFALVMVWQALSLAFFNHVVPNASVSEIRGPFAALSYLAPVFSLGLPFVVFYAGVSMYLGERTRSAVMVWFDPRAGVLALDAAGPKADTAVTALSKVFDGLSITPIQTMGAPGMAMTHWLMTGETPAPFTVDRECELKATDESKATVKYANHELDIGEIHDHISTGKVATKMALTWSDKASFVLTDTMVLKKVTLLDVQNQTEAVDEFDADVILTTETLRLLAADLIVALGGEYKPTEGQV
jgi:hypothetical protein